MASHSKVRTHEQQKCLTDTAQSKNEISELSDQAEERISQQGGSQSKTKAADVQPKDPINVQERENNLHNKTLIIDGKQLNISGDESVPDPDKPSSPNIATTEEREQHKDRITKVEKGGHGRQSLGNSKIIQKGTMWTEKFVLSEKQKRYAQALRAKKTDIYYDNRIVEEFGLLIVDRGHTHELCNSHTKKEDSELNEEKKTHKEEFLIKGTEIKAKTRDKSDGKEGVRKKNSGSEKQMQHVERPSGSLTDKRPLKSSSKKPRENKTSSSGTTQKKEGEPNVAIQTQQTIKSIPILGGEKSGDHNEANVQHNISQMMQAFDLRTDMGRGLLRMQAQFMRTKMSVILPGSKEKFYAYAELMEQMSMTSENLEDDKFWSNLWREGGEEKRAAKLRFLQEMEAFFINGINVDENWRILCLGSLSFVRAVLEGRFFEGFRVMDQYIKQNPGQFANPGTAPFSIMRLWVKIEEDRKNTKIKPIMVDRKEQLEITYTGRTDDQRSVTNQRIERIEESKREERVTVKEDYWSVYAAKEAENGKTAYQIREKGMDTIFCLDASSSMKGEPLRQAKTFIRGFVEGIQNEKHGDDIFEHVSLVTFGSKTKVQVHLTCDYYEFLRNLDQVEPGGPSPMFAGLILSWAAILGGGTIFMNNGYKIYPRIYIVSDGKITPSSVIAGPDSCNSEETKNEHSIVISYSEDLQLRNHLIIHTVPVGAFNMDLLESISSRSGGKVISPENWKTESRSFKNYMRACRLSHSPELHKFILDFCDIDPVDQTQMEEFLRTHSCSNESSVNSNNDGIFGQQINDVFPLGSRVKKKGGPSSSLFGTVTKHFEDGFRVTWDHPNEDNVLRVTVENIDYVEKVDEPRVLKDELIAVGCRVKRGADWKYGNQDGKPGNEGAVFEVQENGTVSVRWDHNGGLYPYRFGQDGRIDLEVIQPPINTTRKTVKITDSVHKKEIKVTNRRNKNIAGPIINKQWKWQDASGSWKAYPKDLSKSLEASYNRNPSGSTLITFEDNQYRISFSTMEQIDINSREKFPVSRM